MDDECSRVSVFGRTTYHMVKCGFQARQKGTAICGRQSVSLFMSLRSWPRSQKRLYPEVAKRFDTTDKQVERAIRNAIETAWTNGNPETLKSVFQEIYGDGTSRPTNTEVIEKLVEHAMPAMDSWD